jgi:CspA family cold shock protein
MSSFKGVVTSSHHLLGRVKWFNNKAGYGFITVTDGNQSGTDVFVHHSAVNVENQQYKYLVQGEYVEFDLIKTESEKHEWQASKVCGIKGGKLMCETRHELKLARTEYKTTTTTTDKDISSEPKMPRQRNEVTDQKDRTQYRERKTSNPRVRGEGPRVRGEGPRDGEKKEWTLVGEKHTQKPKVIKGSTIITIQSK